MAKVAMLLPHPDMLEPAVRAANLYKLEISNLSIVEIRKAEYHLNMAVQNGADIIIARGSQAAYIAQKSSLPVVEIKLTTYEICLLIEQARQLSDQEIPCIALVGPDNMFVNIDVAVLEERYSIRFRLYLFQDPDRMTDSAQSAIDDGADVLIGGYAVHQYCSEKNIPCLRTFSGPESINEACRVAQVVGQALDKEKEQAASLNMLLNHASSGIIQIDAQGRVIRVNQFVEHLLYLDAVQIRNRFIWELIPGITQKRIGYVIEKQQELRSAVIRYGRTEFIVSISPIIADKESSGAIISFHEGRWVEQQELELQNKLIRQGHVANFTFETIIARNILTKKLCEQARHYSTFQFPILILGPSGTEKQILAECIHNNSIYRDKPFIRFNCNGYASDEVERLLFGDHSLSASDESNPGLINSGACTLYLHEVSNLSRHAQYRLLTHITENAQGTGPRQSHARILLSSRYDLLELVEKEQFRRDLYYTISAAILKVPPLSQRREDIMGWADYYLRLLQEHYGRYIRLTKDAQKALQDYSWPGNLMELQTVCSRLLINCHKYYIDAGDVERQLDGDPSQERQETARASLRPQTMDEKAARIIQALHKYEGNREAAAAELNISTTTLWRQMKKYRIPKQEGKIQTKRAKP